MQICFAGVEDRRIRELMVKIDQKNILMSYYYLRNRIKDFDAFKDELKQFDTVLIDSGAFTFFGGSREFDNVGGANQDEIFQNRIKLLDRYVAGYAKFLEKLEGSITAAFEMDVDVLFSSKQCWKWYDTLAQTGVEILPVYHGDDFKKGWLEDNPKEFERWCGEHQYVAIGSSMFGKKEFLPEIRRLIMIARKHKVKVHGLGVTGFKDIVSMPLCTVDSTSWLSGNRFGITYFFQNGRVKSFDNGNKAVRKRWRGLCDKYGVDFERLVADDAKEVELWNALQWKMFADAIEQQHKNRKMEYWLLGGVSEVEEEEKDFVDVESTVIEGELEEEKPELIVPENMLAVIDDKTQRLQQRGITKNPEMLVAGVVCDGCYLGDRCPYYKENTACSIGIDITIKDANDVVGLMQTILELQAERAMRGVFVEKMDGGMINQEVSKELERTVNLMERFKSMFEEKNKVTITAEGKGTGILAQIFGIGK